MPTAMIPDLNDFLAYPLENVAPHAPTSLLLAPGGTRRSAALAGVAESDYPKWAHAQMLTFCSALVRYGVRHIYTGIVLQTQQRESTPWYAGKMAKWAEAIMAAPEALDAYQSLSFRVRVVGTEMAPEFGPLAARLREATPDGRLTLWLLAAPDIRRLWAWMFEAIRRGGIETQGDLLRALYGEDVPPAPLCLSYGKPMLGSDFIPPFLLADRVQCYWTQRPGYAMTDAEWRHILYDYAFLRPTWAEDKSGREQSAVEHRALWESAPILGLGRRVGPFWFPVDGRAIP